MDRSLNVATHWAQFNAQGYTAVPQCRDTEGCCRPYRWCDDWERLLKVDLHRPLLDRTVGLFTQILRFSVDWEPTVRYSEAQVSCVYLFLCKKQASDSA